MADLLSLLSQVVPLKRVAATDGGEYAGPCPFCGGRDRFRVWPNPSAGRPRYWCRVCGRHGDAIQYLRDHEGLSYHEARAQLGEPDVTPDPIPEQRQPLVDPLTNAQEVVMGQFVSEAVEELWHFRGAAQLRYLRDRGLRDRTVLAWQFGYNSHSRRVGDTWFPAGITIPCWEGKELRGVKIRLDQPIADAQGRGARYQAVTGSKRGLWGTETVPGKAFVVICEGELDTALLWQEVGDVVGVLTFTTGAGQYHHWPTDRLLYLAGRRTILVATDADEPGDAAANHILALLGHRAQRLRPPVPKDLTDLYQAGVDLRAWVLETLFSPEVTAAISWRRICLCGSDLEGEPWRVGEAFQDGHYRCPRCSRHIG